jgi:hypothetical protein
MKSVDNVINEKLAKVKNYKNGLLGMEPNEEG